MSDSLQEAQTKLNELLENAKKGLIIPVRLPAQIEEIATLLTASREERRKELAEVKAASANSGDMGEYIQQEAYFVGHAIHEIRNPLTPVKGYVDMLIGMGGLNEMQQQFMGVIKTNVKRLESVILDVGLMNKINKKTIKLEAKMDMFKNIALRVEKDMTPVANDLKRKLIFEIPSGLPMLNLDGQMLTQAIDKLVENGLRYSPEETGEVKVSAVGEGSMLIVTIADNGIGMTPEELARLGEIYFRSDHDTVRNYKGSGLGIPIAYGLFALMDCQVSVESTVGSGTKFTLKIPGMS
jgi:signal transduction histidine kinase